MYQDPRENFKKDHNVSYGRWIWTCIKICILLILIPFVVGALICIAAFAMPFVLIGVPVMVIAWFWVLLT